MDELLALKQKYKDLTGKDFVAAGGAAPATAPPKKKEANAPKPADKPAPKNAEAQASASVTEKIDLANLTIYLGNADKEEVLSCLLVAQLVGKNVVAAHQAPAAVANRVPFYPAIVVPSITSSSGHACGLGTVIFGVASVCAYLGVDRAASDPAAAAIEDSCLQLLSGPLSPSCKDSAGE